LQTVSNLKGDRARTDLFLYGNISGMSDIEKKVVKKSKEKNLPDERYDEKLFKQAYKAAKEAKESEKKEKKKKNILKILLFLSISIIVIFGILILLSFIKPKSEYLQTGQYPSSNTFEYFKEEEISESKNDEIPVTEISALSAILFNPDTGDILYEKEIGEKRYIASLTKILSAMVVLDTFSLDEVIEVSRENIPENLDWQLELENGDRITVENILKAMLMSSYNDTGYIVANAYPYGGYESFINEMNSKAKALRMFNSHFSNPSGIDEEGNYSTAMDVALLITAALRYEVILDTVSLGNDTVNWSRDEEVLSKKIATTNQLYGVNPYSKGFKTGITELAKQCFAGYFEYPSGKRLVTVVLGSEDRFTDTALLEKYSRKL